MNRLPLDRSRRVAFSRQVERPFAAGGSEELEKRFRLPGKFASAIVFLRTDDDDGLSPLFHDALRTVRTHTPEQLAESRLRLMELPDLRIGHAARLCGRVNLVKPETKGVADQSPEEIGCGGRARISGR